MTAMTPVEAEVSGAEGTSVLPPRQRLLVTIILMGATVMVILDTTIANVAIPHMQAALGANSESVAWVLTSYIAASGMAIPITGWLSDRIGRRWLFVIAVAGFTVSSMLCGAAQSLTWMVVARFLQGVFGAPIMPITQSMLYDINPRERHARAMSLYGMAVMVAPVVGPLLGGWLTGSYSWRWVFYINVPIGIVTAFAASIGLPRQALVTRRFDFVGFGLIAVALAAFQLLLDRGTQADWFSSPEIVVEAGLALACVWMAIAHLWRRDDVIVPASLFRDGNFITSLVFVTFLSAVVQAGTAMTVPILQRLLGYPVLDAGLAVVPRGIGTLISFVLAGWLVAWVDARVMVAAGMAMIAAALGMMSHFTLDMGRDAVMWPGLLQGLGQGFVMMPISLIAFVTLKPELRTEAASLSSLMRNLGGSASIASTTALLAGNMQVNHAEVGGRITSPLLESGMIERMGMDSARVLAMVDAEVTRQAAMIAYVDNFWLMMWVTILCTPLLLVVRLPKLTKDQRQPVHAGE